MAIASGRLTHLRNQRLPHCLLHRSKDGMFILKPDFAL